MTNDAITGFGSNGPSLMHTHTDVTAAYAHLGKAAVLRIKGRNSDAEARELMAIDAGCSDDGFAAYLMKLAVLQAEEGRLELAWQALVEGDRLLGRRSAFANNALDMIVTPQGFSDHEMLNFGKRS